MHVIRLYFFLKIKFLLKSLTNNLLYTFFNLAWDKDFVEISEPSIDDFGKIFFNSLPNKPVPHAKSNISFGFLLRNLFKILEEDFGAL